MADAFGVNMLHSLQYLFKVLLGKCFRNTMVFANKPCKALFATIFHDQIDFLSFFDNVN